MKTPVHDLDDDDLLRMAAAPARGIVTGIPHARALGPLVTVFALLPGLYAVRHSTLTEQAAVWNLRAASVLTADDAAGVLNPKPDVIGSGEGVTLRPPLYSWLGALSLGVLGKYPTVALALPSYLAGAGIVVTTYFLGIALLGAGAGLLGSFLMALSAPLLMSVQLPLPQTTAVLWALVTLLCYARHLHGQAAYFSPWLLAGGIAWGLCLLAAGPFALLVPIILGLHVLAVRLRSPGRLLSALREMTMPWRWPPLAAVVILCLVGVVIGGWWHLYMWERYGTGFWASWWLPQAAEQPAVAGAARPESPFPLVLISLMPATVVLALFGLGRAARHSLRRIDPDEERVAGPTLVLLWSFVAALGVLSWPGHPALLQLFLVVPLLLLVAKTLADLAARTVSLRAAAVLGVLTFAVLAWWAIDPVKRATAQAVAGGLRASERNESIAPPSARRFGGAPVAATDTDGHTVHRPIQPAAASEQVRRASEGRPPDSSDWLLLHLFIDLVLLACVSAWVVYRWCAAQESRQRLVLGGLLVAVIALASVRGLAAVRRDTPDDRQLARLGDLLAGVGDVERIWVIVEPGLNVRDQAGDRSRARISTALAVWSTVRTHWPSVPAEWATSLQQWTETDAVGASELVVSWGRREVAVSNLSRGGLAPRRVGRPVAFRDGEVAVYVVSQAAEPAAAMRRPDPLRAEMGLVRPVGSKHYAQESR